MAYPYGRGGSQQPGSSAPSTPQQAQSQQATPQASTPQASTPQASQQQSQPQQQQQSQSQSQQTQSQTSTSSTASNNSNTNTNSGTGGHQVIDTLNRLTYAQMSQLLSNPQYQKNVIAAAQGNLLNEEAMGHVKRWIQDFKSNQANANANSNANTNTNTNTNNNANANANTNAQGVKPDPEAAKQQLTKMITFIREKLPSYEAFLSRTDITPQQRQHAKVHADQMRAKYLEITGQAWPSSLSSSGSGTQAQGASPAAGTVAGRSTASPAPSTAGAQDASKTGDASSRAASQSEDRRGIVGRSKIKEMLPGEDSAETEVEDVLADITDEFIESVVHYACRLARHRKSDRLEIKDVAIHLDQAWGIRVPGFASDEIKQVNRRAPINVSSNHALGLQAVREASKKR